MAQDQKQELIIEAAIKRFAHFGVNKTTMNEIAADLSISKALLYYYFPDKKNLFAAVLQHIAQISAASTDAEIKREPDPMKAVSVFLERRTEFIIKYYNIIEFLRSFKPTNMPKELEILFTNIRKQELNRIDGIIEKGRQNGLFKIDHAEKTAELYYDFLEGFRSSFFLRQPTIFPEKKQFQAILKKEKEFSAIFFKGLTS
jgi:TetR/AcrR family transcriptional regulator